MKENKEKVTKKELKEEIENNKWKLEREENSFSNIKLIWKGKIKNKNQVIRKKRETEIAKSIF